MGYNGNGYEVGYEVGNEDEGERERGGTYRVGTGSELSGVNRSCVRTGSDTTAKNENIGASTVVDENRLDWGSTTSSLVKLVLRVVRDTVDTFGPLRSIAGGL